MESTVLPQHMSQAQFLLTAKASRLVNHGREWEVFLHGKRLGFADGVEMDALVMTHFREINNALYANEKNSPEFYKAELPSHAALVSYPDLVQRFPNAVAKMVNPCLS